SVQVSNSSVEHTTEGLNAQATAIQSQSPGITALQKKERQLAMRRLAERARRSSMTEDEREQQNKKRRDTYAMQRTSVPEHTAVPSSSRVDIGNAPTQGNAAVPCQSQIQPQVERAAEAARKRKGKAVAQDNQ
ncbi:hypothetical protein MKW94_013179, partial [Papaver nudicaule]|nr:hypothetical protein [Papaver nudicaule]